MHHWSPQRPGLRSAPSATICMSSFITPTYLIHGLPACPSSSSSLGIPPIPVWNECSLFGTQLIVQMFFWMSGLYLAQIYSKSGNTTLLIAFFFLAPHTFIARSAYISHQTSGSSVWSHVKRHMCDGTDLSALLQSALFSAIMSRNELGFSFFFDRYFP